LARRGVYFGARYYHPRLGRFISADPLTIHAGGANSNPYAYVSGRVYTHTDPWGFDEDGPVEQPKHPVPLEDKGPPAPPTHYETVNGHRGPREGNGPIYFVPGPRADGIWSYARPLHDSLRQAAVKGGELAKDTADYAKSAASAELGFAAGIATDDALWLLDHTEQFEIGATVGGMVLGSLGAASGGGEGGVLGLAGGPVAEVTVPAGAVAGAIVQGAAGVAIGAELGGNAEKALRIWASKGGGKNAQHANADKRASAAEKYERLNAELDKMRLIANKTPEQKAVIKTMERAVKKAKQDMDFNGENHSQRGKGRR
jgi:uncharacterized protein RhaS with RHS repeats